MGYWGWRPLLLCVFVSVFVVGCNIVSESAPALSATPSPRVTLTVRRQPLPTPTASPTNHTASAAVTTAEPHPAGYITDLSLPTPICSETPAGSLLCLGIVRNNGDEGVEQVQVEVQPLGFDGLPLGSLRTSVEQASIPPGAAAPYQALFVLDPRRVAGASAQLRSVQPQQTQMVTLTVRGARSQFTDGRYIFNATIANELAVDVEAIRLVVTLLDPQDQVAGYRVGMLGGQLAAGAERDVRLEIVPQTSSDSLQLMTYAEGWPLAIHP